MTTVEYVPPPKQGGAVIITMDADEAAKLLALIGKTNGNDFDSLHRMLSDVVSQYSLNWYQTDIPAIDLYNNPFH